MTTCLWTLVLLQSSLLLLKLFKVCLLMLVCVSTITVCCCWVQNSWYLVHHVYTDEISHFGVHYLIFQELERQVRLFRTPAWVRLHLHIVKVDFAQTYDCRLRVQFLRRVRLMILFWQNANFTHTNKLVNTILMLLLLRMTSVWL